MTFSCSGRVGVSTLDDFFGDSETGPESGEWFLLGLLFLNGFLERGNGCWHHVHVFVGMHMPGGGTGAEFNVDGSIFA